MYTCRVTKYNPLFRDKNGQYLRDDWTSIADIGKILQSNNAQPVTVEDYLSIEDTYGYHYFYESVTRSIAPDFFFGKKPEDDESEETDTARTRKVSIALQRRSSPTFSYSQSQATTGRTGAYACLSAHSERLSVV